MGVAGGGLTSEAPIRSLQGADQCLQGSDVRVFIDTNIFISNLFQDGAKWVAFWNWASKSMAKIRIPEVVRDEFLRVAARQVDSLIGEFRKLSERMVRIRAMHEFQIPAHLTGTEVAKANWDSVLRQSTVRVLDHPRASHASLVRRSLEGGAPFSKDGKVGYRDALIWETIKEDFVRDEKELLVLLTANTRDFPFEDLRAELTEFGISSDLFMIVPSLDAFLAQFAYPSLERIAKWEESLKDPHSQERELLLGGLGDHAETVRRRISDALREKMRGSSVSGLRFIEIDLLVELRIQQVLELDAARLLVLCHPVYEVNVEHLWVSDDFEGVGGEFEDYQSDWRDQYEVVEDTFAIGLDVVAILNAADRAVESMDFALPSSEANDERRISL